HQVEKRKLKTKPKLIGVVQGGRFLKLRQECAKKLIKIGFDGLGFGGWPILKNGSFDYRSARTIARLAPKNYYLYGLGIGKPEDIIGCAKLGYNIFDCVLPTRDARHRRLYVFNDSQPALGKKTFYHYLDLNKKKFLNQKGPADKNCDCHLCQNYSIGYLAHLFRAGDSTAFRLATIHNLRFYSRLMEEIRSSA
ncbi:tRNA-guanine transglycosylase, partial [Patescibacteria group bacterium]|nr:tRNA-guanine transglycosylase [Patescibacteria group bacterium]